MTKFNIVTTDENGVETKRASIKNVTRSYDLGFRTAVVDPKKCEVKLMEGEKVVKTIKMNTVPDTRVVHADLLDQFMGWNPKVVVTRTE